MGSTQTHTMTVGGLLVCLFVCAYFSGPTSALRQEVEDFEFADTESDVVKTVVKRSVVTDDEDFLNDEPGSGPDDKYEGSGTEEPPVITVTPKPFAFYRVRLNLSELTFNTDLENRNSRAFQDLAERLRRAVSELLRKSSGSQTVSVLAFDRGSVIATIDISSEDGPGKDIINAILLEALKSGTIGEFRVSPAGYNLQLLGNKSVQCPSYVGRVPTFLPRRGPFEANLLVNNAFPCDGEVTAWEYYRLSPDGTAFVGVWRQHSSSEFVLIRKTELPPASVGLHRVELIVPIPVEQGDFIGIHYSMFATENVIASAMQVDNVVPSQELYQNYLTELYDQIIEEGRPIDLNNFDLSTTNSTFAIRAFVDVGSSGNGPVVPAQFTCGPDQFTCNDGYCIKLRFQCDKQDDCTDGSDEVGCASTGDNCLEGRDACQDGTCIQRGLKCNGIRDCPDGSDEVNCSACSSAEFTCGDGDCQPLFVRCNGEDNCADGSDEIGCPPFGCNTDEFRCGDDICISAKSVCDDVIDCNDRTDERDCTITITGPSGVVNRRERVQLLCNASGNPSELFWSLNGDDIDFRRSNSEFQIRTIPRQGYFESILYLRVSSASTEGTYVCSGADNRRAASYVLQYRTAVTCSPFDFTCSNGECVDRDARCNGVRDCRDQTDERGCPCRGDQFECEVDRCIPLSSRCDGTLDCRNGNDELNCPPQPRCSSLEFECDDGSCVDRRARCDRYPNCPDSSDELKCNCSAVEFRCLNGQCLSSTARCDRKRDCIDNSDEDDCTRCRGDEFECGDGTCVDSRARCDRNANCPDSTDEFNCTCGAAEFRCENGQCVASNFRCDRTRHCVDGSDEDNCRAGCLDGQFQCTNGDCIDRRLTCNRAYDCQDGSDEYNCPTRRPRRCPVDVFQCDSGHCLPMDRHCDGRSDCPNGSDEIDCPTCSPNQFTCTSGECIDNDKRCDGTNDCRDRSDEQRCPCRNGYFTCVSDFYCLPPRYKCNGNPDCRDGSDEENCNTATCAPGQFTCASGECIGMNIRCNGFPDCPDSSDETNCPCKDNEFTCVSDGRCLPSGYECNGNPDCADGSDEDNCGPEPCGFENVRCGSGECIHIGLRCDGRFDCIDRSDESECGCSAGEFTCDNGQCIPSAAKCNGRIDCSDRSDEATCACKDNEFTCVSDGRCLPSGYECNGNPDCADGSDEDNCGPEPCGFENWRCGSGECIHIGLRCDRRFDCIDRSDESECGCSAGEFTCDNGQCIPSAAKCNGRIDCSDRSDEATCECRVGDYICANGQCIPESGRCNRTAECFDQSDERNCPPAMNVTVAPLRLRILPRREATFICYVSGGGRPTVQWVRQSGGNSMPASSYQDETSGRLVIPNVRPEDAGHYTCMAVSGSMIAEATAILQVDYVGPPTDRPDPEGPCGRDQATCSNGDCIPRDYVCDAEDDCTDGSDEKNCTVALPCEPNEFRCNNLKCALKIWRCDGDDDCHDGSDELNCPKRIPGELCTPNEFTCRSNQQCVPLSYQCDGENDCQDNSDESGCRPPTIITPPIKEIQVEINQTFTIVCEAVGVPTPLITWRLNWGNIPTGARVTVTSVDGRGVLEIRNAVISDAGAYTCEAINNRGSIFAIPDALIIVRRTVDPCRSNYFNALAKTPDECIRCFCFGQTKTCVSSDMQISQITLGDRVQLVNRPSNEPAGEGFVQYLPISREFEVKDFNRALRPGSWYWSLPYQYLTKRLSSYGGELSYRVYYDVNVFPQPSNDPDVILIGNGITLMHRSDTQFRPNAVTTVRVPLLESEWSRSRDSRRPGTIISDYATREDLMLVLSNVTEIYIRATYDNRQNTIRLSDVLLTTGVPHTTGRGRAVSVEDCSCPPGYTGDSCEECDRGFYRMGGGVFGRDCVSCQCNGQSTDCDSLTGVCKNCQNNFVGPNCDQCPSGYVLFPRSGLRDICNPCPCPLTTPDNQFSKTCELRRGGSIVCTNCPEGYTGDQCERCDVGYDGSPQTPGDFCRKKKETYPCDPRGSTTSVPNARTGECGCKANVQGKYCNDCKDDTFYLSQDFPYGCIACFCMAVTQNCQSTVWNRAQIVLAFSRGPAGMYITDVMRKDRIEDNLSINGLNRELVYRGSPRIRGAYFWSLPDQFLGDKVTAYGGKLTFTIRHRSGRDSSPLSLREPFIEMTGNGITFTYQLSRQPDNNRPESYSIPFIEDKWVSMGVQSSTREHFLMALADLDAIIIRASFSVDTEETAISSISMDVAESRNTGQERAYAVEQCVCPPGYKGLSCEDCDTGYTRTGNGMYLGLCEPCQCNGHSNQCDPDTGICINCRHNTVGDKCDRCARGFYGDATLGSPIDCQRCPCPLTEAPNQFSPDCILDTDNQVTCTSCPTGHLGRFCERCAPGYMGNPSQIGNYCKVINVTCDCDERGVLPNTQCNPDTQQCQCKTYAVGRRCSACQDGYFNLNRDNDQGCMQCYCMGVSSQCSSSNYYRDEIIPMLNSDGTHNFALTNRRLSRIINDGFTMKAQENEITFNNFEGIQRERESLFIQLPPKFRGDKVTSYGGYLRFGLSYTTMATEGRSYTDVDLEMIGKDDKRLYYVIRPAPTPGRSHEYAIRLVESSFRILPRAEVPSRETFLSVLADIDALLLRASYHSAMASFTLRNVRMDTAVPRDTGLGRAPEVESCECPEGYTGLSCQTCAAGYLRVEEGSNSRCVMCNCNGHASSCDPNTGECQNCQHNTEGDRCERCAQGYYGDATGGTRNDCRVCPCPLTVPSNQFSRTCFLDSDNRVTCDRCPIGYTGRDCGTCARDYVGNPRDPGGRCEPIKVVPQVVVNPTSITEVVGGTAVFQCNPQGRGPFNVVWSRLDGRPLPRRALAGPGPNNLLTISNLEFGDGARYVCTVTSVVGGTSRGYVTLTVDPVDKPLRIRIEDPRTVEVRPGGRARFVCVAVQFSNAAIYVLAWSKDGGQLPAKALDQNGVLVIPNIEEADLGTYRCTGSDPSDSDTATAELRFGTIVAGPTVRIDPRYLQVTEGESVAFKCIADGTPTPTVRWTRGADGPLPGYVYTDETGLFRIDSVSTADQAEYYCTATNSEGVASVRTIIYVERGLQVIVRRAVIEARVGTSERLNCYTQGGDNQVRLVWSREGGLPTDASDQDGVLTLPDIRQIDGGTYICTATTPTGIVGRATVRVTITGQLGVEPTARILPDRQTIGLGSTGTLRCVVTGEPRPQITWRKSQGELSANHQVNGEILRILQATMEDRAIFICEAENIAGKVLASAIVEIERREPPQIELYPTAQQTKTPGSSAMFQCRVVGGIPAPTIEWTRANGLDFTAHTEVISDNGVIRFTGLTAEDQGQYVCTATNSGGTATATASIVIEGPPVITITPSNRITVLVGEQVNVECVGIGEPPPKVFWRSNKRRRSDVLPEVNSGDSTAVLVFSNIDKNDAGRYICTAVSNRGRAEETVDIIVNEQTGPIVKIPGPDRQTYLVGQSVDLQCSTEGIPNPRIRWSRPNNQPLPSGHSVRQGMLHIPRLEEDSAGEYICTVTSQISPRPFSASIYIIVRVTPRLTVSPSRVSTRTGEAIVLRCQPGGPGPFNIEWTKEDGQLNPQAREVNGVLTIRQATRADAGRYRCRATNGRETAEGYADVTIIALPYVLVSPKQESAVPGQTVEFTCQAQGSPQPQVEWTKENGQLPRDHQSYRGKLTLYNVQQEDSGRYICTATNVGGTAQDYSSLRVDGGEVVTRRGVHTVQVGERVELECVVHSLGNQDPVVTWTRLGGSLPIQSQLTGTIIIFDNVQPEDSGTYRCRATSDKGSVTSEVRLIVQSGPTVTPVDRTYTTAALGRPTTLRCDATGSPMPQIQWLKDSGDLPDDHSIVTGGDLFIPRVRSEDAGRYTCLARNNIGSYPQPVVLVVGALVPYFQQNPTSYMAFRPLNDVYLDLDILLSFRPEDANGMLMYNGQYNDRNGDYICFGLQEAYPEFRFDVGSGPAIIRGARPLEMNKWHTIHLKRDRRNGTLIVNDEPEYTGYSPGEHQGLDLTQPFYIGGVPDYTSIPRTAGFSSGFIGGVSQIKVKGISYNIGDEYQDMRDVIEYSVCREAACLNNGFCQPYHTAEGFICNCPRGFVGDRCEQIGVQCYPGACGKTGRCINLPGGKGFDCICPINYSGEGCSQRSITINDPSFNKTSFISYPKITDGLMSVRLQLVFKPRSLDDGIILYNAQMQNGKQDFVAIIIKDSHLEFRFDTGSGPAVLRSRTPLLLNEWTRVRADRKGRDGMLIINNEDAVNELVEPNDNLLFSGRERGDVLRGSTPRDGTIGLNLERSLYLGGVDPSEQISMDTGVFDGFVGCIGGLRINEADIDLILNAIESVNIQDCGDSSPCNRRPCRNGGQCINLQSDYRCECSTGFSGRNCETVIDICLTNNPCVADGICYVNAAGQPACHCSLGSIGKRCEAAIQLENKVEFLGNGYTEFKRSIFPHRRFTTNESLEMVISTTENDGILFWQGQRPGEQGGRDYLALVIIDGYAEFRYELGSGPAIIRSSVQVNDGYPHKIVIHRFGKQGNLNVDDELPVLGMSSGPLLVLNVQGNLFFGGVPDLQRYTAGAFDQNFIGCIASVKIQDRDYLNFGSDALKGQNVRPCVDL